MLYSEAVAVAPPGSAAFRAADVVRLEPGTLRLLLQPAPANPPLEEFALALGEVPEMLANLDPGRVLQYRRLASKPARPATREAARGRLVRGLFWYLVYELAPDRWDELARAEPVHPELIAALPCDGANVLEVAAGSGRLSLAMVGRARRLLALEPSRALRGLLARRLERGWVVAAFAHELPVRDGWADLVISCASLTPQAPVGGELVLAELERCCRPGGTIALVGPENPSWFEAQGYERIDFGPVEVPLCDPELEAFFGRRSPPHELLRKRV